MTKRDKFTKKVREKGLPSTSKFLLQYEKGQEVTIKIDPSVHKGVPHHRYHGDTGKIIKTQGKAYVVRVTKGGQNKKLIVRPEHLRPLKGD